MHTLAYRVATVMAIALSISVHTAGAQDSTKAPPTMLHLDFGYVSTSGNSVVSTLNFADAFTARPSSRNEIDQTFAVVYGTSDNKVRTSLWTAGLRDQYKFTPIIGLYVLGNFDRNTFAGIEHRFEEGAGLAITAVDTHHDHVEFAVGASYVETQATDSTDSSSAYAAIRTSGLYKHTIRKDTYVQEFLEGIPDLKTASDFRINSQTDIVAALSKHLALKVGYAIRYAHLPPPGFKTTDRLFTSDLQVTF
jgi:putative salt-induced outer membrane protein YdiY